MFLEHINTGSELCSEFIFYFNVKESFMLLILFLIHLYLSQRAWLLKLLAIALHNGSGSSSDHLEACQSILSHLFGREVTEAGNELYSSSTYPLQDGLDYAGTSSISKSKVS